MSSGQDVAESWRVDVREEAEKMTEFVQQLIRHSQFTLTRSFTTGSQMEIYGQLTAFQVCQLDEGLVDDDQMFYSTDQYAFPLRKPVPKMYDGKVIRICSSGVHPGYTKLIDTSSNTEFLLLKTVETRHRHCPAEQGEVGLHYFRIDSEKQLMVQSHLRELQALSLDSTFSKELVAAVHSPYWPHEAYEWVTRPRMHGSPAESTIKEAIRYGCDFVQVSHSLSSNCSEFRFSFSMAELIIIRNWTSQRIVYRTFHLLNKMIKSRTGYSRLCSYYFKTLMLWAAEEKPAEFWFEDVLLDSVCELLLEFTNWLKNVCCPNYFIPTNNIIDHLTDDDLSDDFDSLYELLRIGEDIGHVLYQCKCLEVLDCRYKYWIEAPLWIWRSIVIFDRIVYTNDNYRNLVSSILDSDTIAVFSCELSGLFHAVSILERAARCIKLLNELSERNDVYIYKAVNHLANDLVSGVAQVTHKLPCSRAMATQVVSTWFLHEREFSEWQASVRPGTASSVSSLNVLNECADTSDQMCLLYRRSMDDEYTTLRADEKCSNNGSEINIARYIMSSYYSGKTSTDVKFLKAVPGVSPTVNVSYFLCRAYLANLYRTIHHNYTAAEETCDDIINLYKHSVYNQHFAELSVPVVLSAQWMSVYDEELQAIFGLYSLCTFIQTDRGRSVYADAVCICWQAYTQ